MWHNKILTLVAVVCSMASWAQSSSSIERMEVLLSAHADDLSYLYADTLFEASTLVEAAVLLELSAVEDVQRLHITLLDAGGNPLQTAIYEMPADSLQQWLRIPLGTFTGLNDCSAHAVIEYTDGSFSSTYLSH